MLRPASRMRIIFTSKNAIDRYTIGFETNRRRPKTVATTKLAQVQGSISFCTSVTGRLRATKPASRRSNLAMEPTTSTIAATWMVSNIGNNHTESRMDSASDVSFIHWKRSTMPIELSVRFGSGRVSGFKGAEVGDQPASTQDAEPEH